MFQRQGNAEQCQTDHNMFLRIGTFIIKRPLSHQKLVQMEASLIECGFEVYHNIYSEMKLTDTGNIDICSL